MKTDYDVVVLGAGAAGLAASGIAASFGAKTLLVEHDRLGGDCTWTGCIPSKTLLQAARVAHVARDAHRWGLQCGEPEVDFHAVMQRVHAVRQQIYDDADRPEHMERLGIHVAEAHAEFLDPHTLHLTRGDARKEELRARKILIATGSRPTLPPIEGLEGSGYLTNETLFELDTQPRRLLVLGGGPIGIEMAQAFTRLGTETHVFDIADRILGRDDPETAGIVQEALKREGVQLHLGTKIDKVARTKQGFELRSDTQQAFRGDQLLVAVGRNPDVASLHLDRAGLPPRGPLEVDLRCRTGMRHIFAAGDVTAYPKLTHMAEHMAKIATTNALFPFGPKLEPSHLSWCTYTDPELAHVGATQAQLEQTGTRFEVHRFPYAKADRAITDGRTDGLIKVCASPLRGRVLGVSIAGAHAGELIASWAIALRSGIALRHISDTIHPYPTYALANRRAADAWYLARRPMWLLRWLHRLLGLRGRISDTTDLRRLLSV